MFVGSEGQREVPKMETHRELDDVRNEGKGRVYDDSKHPQPGKKQTNKKTLTENYKCPFCHK